MLLKEIITALEAAPVFAPEGWESVEVSTVFASDLISDILVSDGVNQLLITSLTTPQVVRTAGIVGATAIILVHRRQAPAGLEDAARAADIPLFRSSITKYDACVRIGRMEDTQ